MPANIIKCKIKNVIEHTTIVSKNLLTKAFLLSKTSKETLLKVNKSENINPPKNKTSVRRYLGNRA